MNITTTGRLTCRHQEAEQEEGGAATLTPMITTAMKITTITTDTTTTTTGEATTTPTMATTTSKGLCEGPEGPEEASAEEPARPEAVGPSHPGADWASPNAEALEQSEVPEVQLNISVYYIMRTFHTQRGSLKRQDVMK